MIYSLILLSCFFVGIPNASINSSFLRLNQLTCEIPSMLSSNFHSVFCLREQTALSVLKCRLNSREYSSPLMETSLNVHSFLMTTSPKCRVSRRNFIVGINFSTYGKLHLTKFTNSDSLLFCCSYVLFISCICLACCRSRCRASSSSSMMRFCRAVFSLSSVLTLLGECPLRSAVPDFLGKFCVVLLEQLQQGLMLDTDTEIGVFELGGGYIPVRLHKLLIAAVHVRTDFIDGTVDSLRLGALA